MVTTQAYRILAPEYLGSYFLVDHPYNTVMSRKMY